MTQRLRLNGVHHSARPTWKLKETVEFYRDLLGLPLVHSVSARGWGREKHPDFLHFFFDSGAGSTIAFFYYLGHSQPDYLVHRPRFDSDALHTAWRVETREELIAWRSQLEARGIPILFQIEHEVIESLYFRDPNGYFLEITCPLREFIPLDVTDAQLTLQAAIEAEEAAQRGGSALSHIEGAWRLKGELLARGKGSEPAVILFIPDIPEFLPLVTAAKTMESCTVQTAQNGYWTIETPRELRLFRKELGLTPAIWNSALSGGFCGRILEYGRDIMRIESEPR